MGMAQNIYFFFRTFLIVLSILILFGKVTADVNQCGTLKIEQPTILGRNVTFTFTPETTSDADLKWQRTDKRNPWSTLPNNNKFTQYSQDGTYYLILTDTVRGYDESFYRIVYKNNSVNCLMETPKLQLKDISSNGCGFVYLRTTKLKEGENVELEYYPSKYVMKYPERTVRQWMHSTDLINVTKNVYEEERGPNDKYVLTIIMFNERMDGRYVVFCGESGGYSNIVEVILPVPPSTPVFEGLKDIEDCKECIVGEDGDQFSVHCKTSGGTQPVTVTMSIGNESLSLDRYNETAGYITYFALRNRHHMTIMTCTVMNYALTSPLITTARVYVIKSPTLQLFVPQILKEGNNGNITCIVDGGRPAPNVTINISGMEMSSAVQTDSFSATTSLYTSVVSLSTFERIWNSENVQCCRFNEWYMRTNVCSPQHRINVMFPHTDIKLEVKVEQKRPLEIYAICTVYNSNPACRADISAPNGVIVSERYTNNMSRAHGAWDSEYAVNLNVDKNDDGEKIKCAADCQKFAVDLKDVHSIGLPQKHEKRYKDSDKAASCENASIWIILGSCLAVLFVVVIVCLIAIKKFRDTKAELEAYKVRFSANPDRIRNDVELEDRAYENSSRNDVELENRAYENTSRNDVELEDRAYENSSRNDVELEDRAYERLNDTRQATGQSETFYSQLSP